jgi:AcrR family transcriptional regulator
MFFDVEDYLESDPAQAGSERERERLWREAEQRAKLCEATTQLAAAGGLEAAAIHLAARRAGVGQGTYYKLYDSKEACVCDAFERCADTVLGRIEAAAARNAGDFAERLEAGLGELLALLDAHPEVARLLLVEILVGDDRCRLARERWLGRLAGLLACEGGAGAAPQRGSLVWLATGALANVLAFRLDRGDAGPRPELLEELVRVGSWPQRVETTLRTKGAVDDRKHKSIEATQRGRRAAHRLRARRDQRQRILAAMIETVGTEGYRAARVADVLERAGLSAPVFYAHFSGKEECLLAAFELRVASMLERAEAAVASAATGTERAEAGLRALVDSLAEQPAAARLVTIEIRRVGARGEERYGEALASFARVIAEAGTDRQAGTASDVPRQVAATVVGMIAREVGEGRAAQLQALLPELAFAVLAPCVGGERAAEEMRRVASARRG